MPRDLASLADSIDEPALPNMVQQFLAEQLGEGHDPTSNLPIIHSRISVFRSAVAMFYAPSDPSGIRGMKRERIRCTPSWRGQGPLRDCALVVEDQEKPGMRGLRVVRVKLFFSFDHRGITYPCALVEWFKTLGRAPDPDTGMWMVRPEFSSRSRDTSILHLDTFLRGAHLLPCFSEAFLPRDFNYTYSLDAFQSYFVNQYIDHHSHKIIF